MATQVCPPTGLPDCGNEAFQLVIDSLARRWPRATVHAEVSSAPNSLTRSRACLWYLHLLLHQQGSLQDKLCGALSRRGEVWKGP